MSTANEDDVFVIGTNYLKILMASEAMTETKANIYGAPVEMFQKYLHPKYKEPIGRPMGQLKLLLQTMTFEKHERHRAPRAAKTEKKGGFINFLFGKSKKHVR